MYMKRELGIVPYTELSVIARSITDLDPEPKATGN